MAQGNDAAAGSRRGRSFERLEELCLKAAGTPPATFWGVFYGFVGAACLVEPARNRFSFPSKKQAATTRRQGFERFLCREGGFLEAPFDGLQYAATRSL